MKPDGKSRSPKLMALGFIILLGIVSLFADMTYEGGRSLSGQYLNLLGAGALALSLAAGLGEFLGYSLRFFSGILVDRSRRYWAIVFIGYTIQLAALPALALTGDWRFAIVLLLLERIAKAFRKPASDAMLAYAASSTGRGFGFGLHEALDQIGAFMGPALLALLLFLRKDSGSLTGLRTGLSLLFLPAGAAVLSLAVARFFFPRPDLLELESKKPRIGSQGISYGLWIVILAAGILSAGIIDFPLIAYHFQKVSIVTPALIPLLYAGAMAIDAVSALGLGALYDRVGYPALLILFVAEIFTAPLIFLGGTPAIIGGMALWGISMGAQESVLKAVIADQTSKDKRGTAFGLFHTIFGLFRFGGSAIIGLLYGFSIPLMALVSVGFQFAALILAIIGGVVLKRQDRKALS
jgi:MFS family permease